MHGALPQPVLGCRLQPLQDVGSWGVKMECLRVMVLLVSSFSKLCAPHIGTALQLSWQMFVGALSGYQAMVIEGDEEDGESEDVPLAIRSAAFSTVCHRTYPQVSYYYITKRRFKACYVLPLCCVLPMRIGTHCEPTLGLLVAQPVSLQLSGLEPHSFPSMLPSYDMPGPLRSSVLLSSQGCVLCSRRPGQRGWFH